MLRSLNAPGMHLRPALCLLFALAVVVSALPSAAAQERANKTSPRSVLGFTPGDDRKVADWRQITDYFSRLDIASDRISVRTLGETTLGRPLIVAFVSAAENIRHLNRYQEIQRKLADPRAVSDKAEGDALLRDGKVVVAISCSVNADEIVASQLSMQLAYELATARDAATLNILQNTILLLIPSGNPDGLDLVAGWYRKTLGTPYEGKLPPELSHPYAGQDNSLDWLTLNLKETRLIARLLWKEWFPHLVYDLHEHSAAPARFTIAPLDGLAVSNILSSLNHESEALRLGLAADLEAAGFGDAATGPPCETGRHANLQAAAYYHNAVTLVSETMSAKLLTPLRWGSAAPVGDGAEAIGVAAASYRQKGTGGLWRPRDMLLLGERAVISVLSQASERRADYLRNFYELGRANIAATTYWPRAYLLPAGQSPDEALAQLVGVLLEQGIEVFRLDGELHISNQFATTHRMGARRDMKETPAGGYIIFLAQPYGSLVRALFEPRASANDCTTSSTTRRKSEATGVSLPIRMGVEAETVWMIRESRSEMKLALVTSREVVYRDLGLPASGRRGLRARSTTRPMRLGVYKSWTRSPDEGWTRFVPDSFGVPYQYKISGKRLSSQSAL